MDDHLTSAAETLVHAGSRRASGEAVAPPLVPASIFVSSGEPDPVRAYGRRGGAVIAVGRDPDQPAASGPRQRRTRSSLPPG